MNGPLHEAMNASGIVEGCHTAIDITAAQLDHEVWNHASPVQITRYWSGKQAPANRHAEARIVWSEEALIVRFVCPQAEPLVVNAAPQVKEKTLGLWDRDVCEVFIAPNPEESNRYFEFEAAPTGEWVDLAIHSTLPERVTDFEFYSGMTVAGRVVDSQISIAMRIPWGGWSHRPQRSEKWRINLFRCVGSGTDRGYLAWQPTLTQEPHFHVPQAFGWLQFS